MKTIPRLAIAVLAALSTLGLSLAVVTAEERHIDFVHRLQEQGYGELAVYHLDRLEGMEDLPEEVREVLELERGKSLRVAADEAPNPDQAQQRLAEAQEHLNKFLETHPDHGEAPAALGAMGDIASQRGQLLLKLARATGNNKVKQGEYFEGARAAFEQSRPRFTRSVELYQERLREVPARKKEPAKKVAGKGAAQKPVRRPTSRTERQAAAERQEAEILWLEARLKLALVDYYISQTHGDPNDPARKAALQQAASGFDGIYQQYRTFEVGLYAHMWHGKAVEEMGDTQTALDIYDEVLVNAPEGGQPHAPTGLEPLFAQVEYFRLTILAKKGDLATFYAEAAEWLRLNQASRKTPGYQGIALELAKFQIAQAEKASGEERHRMFILVLRALAEITKVPSEYQQEAFLLRRQHQEESTGAAADIGSFDEALSVADAAAGAGQWQAAASAYSKGVELGDGAKNPQRVIATRYRLAHAQYMAGQVKEAADTAEEIARGSVTSPSAPPAAALAVSASLALYANATDPRSKEAALERLTQIANYTAERWPERPESDDARIALGQSHLVRGDLEGAITVFERVSPQSERHPVALHMAGQAHWRSYLTEKQKPESARDAARLEQLRAKAWEQLSASFEAQKKAAKEGEPMARQLADTQLLLGEMALEGGAASDALPLLEPLVALIRTSKPQTLDLTTLRTLVAALRAHVAVGDLPRAAEVESIVVEIGSDSPQVNSVLVDFAKLLGNELKRAEAEVIAAGSAARASETAQAGLQGTRQLFATLLGQLATREHHTLGNLIYIADSFARLDLNEQARDQYLRLLRRAEEDPSFLPASTGPAAISRVRAQLVGLLRQEGKFELAMQEVEKLIASNQKGLMLAPEMEKGRILQAWAETEPKRYDDALTQWTRLRTLLARLQRKPPEYYEVVYNAAACLAAQARQSQDKAKALQAEQLLKSTLVLSPNLSGPDMVARYNELLRQAAVLQGRTP